MGLKMSFTIFFSAIACIAALTLLVVVWFYCVTLRISARAHPMSGNSVVFISPRAHQIKADRSSIADVSSAGIAEDVED